MIFRTLSMLAVIAALGACTSTGNVERNAIGGAAIGGVAGAAIGNNTGSGNAGQGAAIGAAIGGAAGAVRGYGQDQRLTECRQYSNEPLYRDLNTGRAYYMVPGTNRTCWADGAPR